MVSKNQVLSQHNSSKEKSMERQPILVASSFITDDGSIESKTHSELILISELKDVIPKIIRLCDGRNQVPEIIKSIRALNTENSVEIIRDIIDDLFTLGIVIDSRKFGKFIHSLSSNPMPYYHALTDAEIEAHRLSPRVGPIAGERLDLPTLDTTFTKMLEKRFSCRNFDGQPLSLKVYSYLLRSAYETALAPVPSGGALYPPSVYLIVIKGSTELEEGLYQYDPKQPGLIAFDKEYDELQLIFALDSENLIHRSSGVIVISADLQRQSGKYSNRGYRYSMIEAGHVAQNVMLAAVDAEVATLEYGGFRDDDLTALLNLDARDEVPVICIALGKVNRDEKVSNASATRNLLEEQIVGRSKPVNWVYTVIKEGNRQPPFHTALAHYKPGAHQKAKETYRGRLALGTSESSDLATIKAIAEAYERYICGQPYVDIVSSAIELDSDWVDPNRYVPFTESQLERLGFEAFSPNTEWQWVVGESASGDTVYVPADMVFYPFSAERDLGRKNCYSAHSNGVAAHTSLEEAKLRALHELIERDAIIRNWLLKETPDKIPTELLPLYWRKRVKYWGGLGWRIDVVDFSRSGVAIVSAFARSDNGRPYMSHGSAASSSSFDSTVSKAFHEMEVGLSVNRDRKRKRVHPEKVDSPEDHGALYHHNDYSNELAYLFVGEYVNGIPRVGCSDLPSQYDTVFVTLTPKDSPLHVVRAISDRLVPINFGYGRDHMAHHLLKEVVDQRKVPFPHYLA